MRFWQGVVAGGLMVVGLALVLGRGRRRRVVRLWRSRARGMGRAAMRKAGTRMGRAGRTLRAAWRSVRD